MRFRLRGAPGIKHELCSYPAVLSSSNLPLLAFRTSISLSHRPSDQWFHGPVRRIYGLWILRKSANHVFITYMCVATVCWYRRRINKDYSILFYSILFYSPRWDSARRARASRPSSRSSRAACSWRSRRRGRRWGRGQRRTNPRRYRQSSRGGRRRTAL